MAQIEYIKHLYENEDKSLKWIAKNMGLNYRTVRKYALMEDMSLKDKPKRKKYFPVLGPYLEYINTWLEEDLKVPRKQRHTATRIYDRLVEEYGYGGARKTVSNYVSKKRKELNLKTKGFLPLEHLPGEAQLDFGEMLYIDINNTEKKGHYLTLTFPNSNAGFTQIFEGQNQECVMEGLKRFFKYIGGVPKVIVMDNMRTVVSKILKGGEREITEGFNRFALHYRFQMRFCNPASGNEKGSVENKIGYHRRNWFVPIPKIEDLEEYNQTLWEKAIKDMNRSHYKKQISISSLWEEDKKTLLYLPENEYSVFRLEEARINEYGCIKFEDNSYTVSPEMAGEIVSLKIYYDRIEILQDNCHLMTYKRNYGRKEEIFDWKQYLSLLTKKPGALEHTKFYHQIPKLWRDHLVKVKGKERKSALMLLRDLVNTNDLENGTTALELAISYGKTDIESIRQCYYGLTHDTNNPKPCPLNSTVPLLEYNPELTSYDKLARRGVS